MPPKWQLRSFAPAMVVWPLWFYAVSVNSAWRAVFSDYWSMTVAMVAGSFIAGSTPLGGGVVAYPVAQLVLIWPTPDSRDASILVQSIGMTAASYLLCVQKPELLDFDFIFAFTSFGSLGVLLGLTYAPSPGLANIMFATAVLMFAIAYFYASELVGIMAPPSKLAANDATLHARSVAFARRDTRVLMVACALAGGFLTANVGSGSDIALYAFGVFGWNTLHPHLALSDTRLTASSVVVMALLSIFTSLARALEDGGFQRKILLCWGADAPIVVLGAPIGSLVLNPSAQVALRRLFYVLAVVQFISYHLMEEAFYDDRVAPYVGLRVWFALGPLFAGELALLAWHFTTVVPRLRASMH